MKRLALNTVELVTMLAYARGSQDGTVLVEPVRDERDVGWLKLNRSAHGALRDEMYLSPRGSLLAPEDVSIVEHAAEAAERSTR